MIAFELLADVTNGIQSATFVKFIDGHNIGEVEHVNLLKLRRSSELRGHDIE